MYSYSLEIAVFVVSSKQSHSIDQFCIPHLLFVELLECVRTLAVLGVRCVVRSTVREDATHVCLEQPPMVVVAVL